MSPAFDDGSHPTSQPDCGILVSHRHEGKRFVAHLGLLKDERAARQCAEDGEHSQDPHPTPSSRESAGADVGEIVVRARDRRPTRRRSMRSHFARVSDRTNDALAPARAAREAAPKPRSTKTPVAANELRRRVSKNTCSTSDSWKSLGRGPIPTMVPIKHLAQFSRLTQDTRLHTSGQRSPSVVAVRK